MGMNSSIAEIGVFGLIAKPTCELIRYTANINSNHMKILL